MASNTMNLNTYRAKLLSNSYGSTTQPVYINDGVPTILGTIGGEYEPVWVDSGVVKAITAGTTAQFYRGDKTWSNVLTGGVSIRVNGEGYVLVSDGTHYSDDTFRVVLDLNPTSGNHGIYSSGYSDGTTFTSSGKWLLVRDAAGDVQMNGNADTATKVKVTNVALPSSGNSTYYLTFSGSTTTGNQDIKNAARLYLWENTTTSYLNVGTGSIKGGLTLHRGNTYHGDIVTDNLTANQTYTLPNATGWIVTGGNGTSTGAGDSDTPVYLKTDGTLAAITSYDGNAATATTWQTARTLTVGATGKSVNGSADVSWSMNEIMGSSDSSKFYRGDKTWSNTIVGDFVVNGNLSVGNNNASNYITFYGIVGDNPTQWAQHDYIGNRLWGSNESSELVLFKGNDVGNESSATTVSGAGPDRIRHIAAAHLFQTYSAALSGTFEAVCTSSSLVNIFEINTNNLTGYKRMILQENNSWLSPARLQLLRPDTTTYSDRACVGVTDGNLHIDAYQNKGLYLNYYSSGGNVYFNGSTYYINGGNYNGTAANADTVDSIHARGLLRTYYSNSDLSSTDTMASDNYLFTVGDTGSWPSGTKPSGVDNAFGILHLHLHTGNYFYQLGFGGTTNRLYYRNAYATTSWTAWQQVLFSSNGNIAGFRNEAASNRTYYWGFNGGTAETYAVHYTNMVVGNATNADTLDGYHHDSFVKLAGDSMTGRLSVANSAADPGANPSAATIELREAGRLINGSGLSHTAQNAPRLGFHWGNRYWAQLAYFDNAFRFYNNALNGYVPVYGSAVYNAVWNDYAECREADTIEPGYCVTETSNNIMIKTTERLMPGCKLISDTYGHLMGETECAKTPIAVAGRVLAYTYRDRNEYSLGAAVCSAPNGTIDIMTREEIMAYPERIVGTVSEIPTYEVWHGGNQDGENDILVKGRIWIYVR